MERQRKRDEKEMNWIKLSLLNLGKINRFSQFSHFIVAAIPHTVSRAFILFFFPSTIPNNFEQLRKTRIDNWNFHFEAFHAANLSALIDLICYVYWILSASIPLISGLPPSNAMLSIMGNTTRNVSFLIHLKKMKIPCCLQATKSKIQTTYRYVHTSISRQQSQIVTFLEVSQFSSRVLKGKNWLFWQP